MKNVRIHPDEPRERMLTIRSRAGGGDLHALEFGDANRPIDVIFLHANGFNARTYRQILAPLANQLRILAVDQRGHGATRLSAEPSGRRNWLDFRDDLVGLLEAIGGPPVVLSGHSLGATASLFAAAAVPERVRGLVLFEPVVRSRLAILGARLPFFSARRLAYPALVQGALKRRARFDSRETAVAAYLGRGAFRTWPAEFVADYVAGGFADCPNGGVALACAPAWEASNYAAQGHDPWGAMAKLRCPLTIFKAERDSTCQIDTGDRRRRSVTLVPGSTHFLPMEHPQLVRDALLAACR